MDSSLVEMSNVRSVNKINALLFSFTKIFKKKLREIPKNFKIFKATIFFFRLRFPEKYEQILFLRKLTYKIIVD